MIADSLITYLVDKISEEIISVTPLMGGDINEVFLLTTSHSKLVIKVNDALRYPNMFEREAYGLSLLKEKQHFEIPEVLFYDVLDQDAFLVMSYINSSTPQKNFWQDFGYRLAKLHQCSQSNFGLGTDNYIGSLPQYNKNESSAVDFYINQRLIPQFQIALEQGYSFQKLDVFYKKLQEIIPDERPALIHGDLWSGNYMVGSKGNPCLVDPAVAFAPREMDIALMHLFGGFDRVLFDAYQEEFSLQKGWQERLEIWQLYYVLVHLNLFGSAYYQRIISIINRIVS